MMDHMKMDHEETGFARWITSLVTDFLDQDESNRVNPDDGEEKFWGKPLTGFTSGTDPYYAFFKEDIGDFYRTPLEFFRLAYPDTTAVAEELGIVSWVLPQSEKTRQENREQAAFPAVSWSRARIDGEVCNRKLGAYLENALRQEGIEAVAPLASADFIWADSPKYGAASNWSERHTAFVCGLGTFGLCDGLITEAGKAVRFGSMIFRHAVRPTPRPYTHHHAYCLYYAKGSCMACARRCPGDAVGPEGHDKKKCREYQAKVVVPVARKTFPSGPTGCGLCQTGVPCEDGIPAALRKETLRP